MMPRGQLASRLVAAALALAAGPGCFRDHPGDAVQTVEGGCRSCHLHDFQAAIAPAHEGVFPRTCADCHVTVGWSPALEGMHPATARFRIDRGDHRGIACLACHDPARGSSTGGANAICAECHTHRRGEVDDEHDDVRGYQWDAADPAFCLDCHRDGED